jgi:hypothetical protein
MLPRAMKKYIQPDLGRSDVSALASTTVNARYGEAPL